MVEGIHETTRLKLENCIYSSLRDDFIVIFIKNTEILYLYKNVKS